MIAGARCGVAPGASVSCPHAAHGIMRPGWGMVGALTWGLRLILAVMVGFGSSLTARELPVEAPDAPSEDRDPASDAGAPAAPARLGAIELSVGAVAWPKPELGNVRGTAFLLSKEGWMATADHVVCGSDNAVLSGLSVLLPSQQGLIVREVREVRRLRSDVSGRDIALMRIEPGPELKDRPRLEIGPGAALGDEVLVAGYPLVFDKVYRWPLLRWGRISSTRYHLRKAKVFVLDLTSAGGFSGSPVIRVADGKVVAVLKGKATGNSAADFSLGTQLLPADLEP